MKKSAKILKSYELTKLAYYENYSGEEVEYDPPATAFDVGATAAGYGGFPASIAGYRLYKDPSLRTVKGFGNQFLRSSVGSSPKGPMFTPPAPVTGTGLRAAGQWVGGRLTPVIGGTFAAYGVQDRARAGYKDYASSEFADRPGGFINYLNTTGGRNRVADVVGSGGITLGAMGTGAAIGSIIPGLGTAAGAGIGAIVGGLGELGYAGYRKATGWDGGVYNEAKRHAKGNIGVGDAINTIMEAQSGGYKEPKFQTKKLFGGTRNLAQEALADVQKENAYSKIQKE